MRGKLLMYLRHPTDANGERLDLATDLLDHELAMLDDDQKRWLWRDPDIGQHLVSMHQALQRETLDGLHSLRTLFRKHFESGPCEAQPHLARIFQAFLRGITTFQDRYEPMYQRMTRCDPGHTCYIERLVYDALANRQDQGHCAQPACCPNTDIRATITRFEGQLPMELRINIYSGKRLVERQHYTRTFGIHEEYDPFVFCQRWLLDTNEYQEKFQEFSQEREWQTLAQFIESLPPSSVRVLVFTKAVNQTCQEEWMPRINQTAKKWDNPPYYEHPIYMITSEWADNTCYMYKEANIRHGAHSQWGDHLAVGVEQRPGIGWMLMTNKVCYIPFGDRYTRWAECCDVKLAPTLHENATCYSPLNEPNGKSLATYATVCKDADAVPMLRSIHSKIMGDGWPKEAEDGFTQEFLDFILASRVLPVHRQVPALFEVMLVDDAESDSIMMMFQEDLDGERANVRASIFAVEKDMLFEAFAISKIPALQRTQEQIRTLEVFEHMMVPVRMVPVMA